MRRYCKKNICIKSFFDFFILFSSIKFNLSPFSLNFADFGASLWEKFMALEQCFLIEGFGDELLRQCVDKTWFQTIFLLSSKKRSYFDFKAFLVISAVLYSLIGVCRFLPQKIAKFNIKRKYSGLYAREKISAIKISSACCNVCCYALCFWPSPDPQNSRFLKFPFFSRFKAPYLGTFTKKDAYFLGYPAP